MARFDKNDCIHYDVCKHIEHAQRYGDDVNDCCKCCKKHTSTIQPEKA